MFFEHQHFCRHILLKFTQTEVHSVPMRNLQLHLWYLSGPSNYCYCFHLLITQCIAPQCLLCRAYYICTVQNALRNALAINGSNSNKLKVQKYIKELIANSLSNGPQLVSSKNTTTSIKWQSKHTSPIGVNFDEKMGAQPRCLHPSNMVASQKVGVAQA